MIYDGLGYRQEDGVYKVEGNVRQNVRLGNGYNYIRQFTGYVNGTSVSTNSGPIAATPTEQTTCRKSLTKVNNVSPCANTLIFEDNFDSIDETRWSKLRQFSVEPVTIMTRYESNSI